MHFCIIWVTTQLSKRASLPPSPSPQADAVRYVYLYRKKINTCEEKMTNNYSARIIYRISRTKSLDYQRMICDKTVLVFPLRAKAFCILLWMIDLLWSSLKCLWFDHTRLLSYLLKCRFHGATVNTPQHIHKTHCSVLHLYNNSYVLFNDNASVTFQLQVVLLTNCLI